MHAVGIDFGKLTRDSSPAPSGFVIAGNQFSLRGDCTALRFPADAAVRSRIHGIEIGVNSSRCPTYLEGFAPEMGRSSPEASQADPRPPSPHPE